VTVILIGGIKLPGVTAGTPVRSPCSYKKGTTSSPMTHTFVSFQPILWTCFTGKLSRSAMPLLFSLQDMPILPQLILATNHRQQPEFHPILVQRSALILTMSSSTLRALTQSLNAEIWGLIFSDLKTLR
jgi:hypothetical protein